MSGGFFRGTSADQDTRFSNKQAKLLKSQKFAPELDHLVDISKVKMDVIRPWIATRVTELLGFEDEVLINFIYGLLDGKEVNGKQVQISLTGFMEKNTGKFMKELWSLLLSAQRNASGVPQQFLDAKEEETRKKKAESDRIASEIQKKKDKESRELEQERLKEMDNGNQRKAGESDLEPPSNNMLPKGSSGPPEDEIDADRRNGVRRKRLSRSPRSTDRSPSPRSLSRSASRSFSNSRSYSDDKRKSRSLSRSPQPRKRSISSDRMYRSPRRRSLTPRSRHSPRSSRSPARRRPSYSRRRSRSRSLRRSPSPVRHRLRSPYRRRSPTPVRRRSPVRRYRSPSPRRGHRSLLSSRRRISPSLVRRRRSPSPVLSKSRSPVRSRSPSPIHRRSPLHVRRRSPSPLRHRLSPSVHRRSPSPVRRRRHRSSSTPRQRSSSLVRRRSPASSRRSITPPRGNSLSPYQSSSLSPVQRRSSSPGRRSPKEPRSPLSSLGEGQRKRGKLSPVGRRPSSLRSPLRDLKDQRGAHDKVPKSLSLMNKSPVSKSPSRARNRSPSEDGRLTSPCESPTRKRRERIACDDSLSPERKPRELKGQHGSQRKSDEAGRSRHSPLVSKQRLSPREVHTPERVASSRSTESRSRLDDLESRKKDLEMKSKRSSGKGVRLETPDQQRSPALSEDSFQGSEEDDKCRTKRKEKRKHKRSERREDTSDDCSSYDSEIEDRKEAKRRKKEEKRLRKEERRKRRQERRRRKEERHAEKLKMKGQDDDSNSDGEHGARRKSHPIDDEEAENEQKRLEIELRRKAIESLKAKKGISS
ncbi:hypothetical protein DITRI_Ditri05aG0035400 [Diplodiscus trichospermus]